MQNHFKQTDDEMVRFRSENKEHRRTVQEPENTTSKNLELINCLQQYGLRKYLEIKAWLQHESIDELTVDTVGKRQH